MRIHDRGGIAALASVLLCICLIVTAGSYFQSKEHRTLIVEVINPRDEEGMGAISILSIEVTNEDSSSIQPAFSIMWNVTSYYWNVLEGPELLQAGSSALYRIEAPIAQAIVPNGETFIVKVNDVHNSVFFVSKPIQVDLEASPPILNANFKYWITDQGDKKHKPFDWQLLETIGKGDAVSISHEIIDGRYALEMSVTQDGVQDEHDWALANVRQLMKFPTSSIGLWVYPTFTYKDSASPQNVLGLETNDGTHVVWFVFSDDGEGTYGLSNQRTIVVKAPLNEWSYHEIDVAEEYQELGYQSPEYLFFGPVVGASTSSPGTYTASFADITQVP
jgi:hypothetical protein